jgi:hypothetical protein
MIYNSAEDFIKRHPKYSNRIGRDFLRSIHIKEIQVDTQEPAITIEVASREDANNRPSLWGRPRLTFVINQSAQREAELERRRAFENAVRGS